MPYPIEILTVEMEGEDGVIVTFSDGTTGAYVVEELLGLRPHREPTEPSFIAPLKFRTDLPMRRGVPRLITI
jgi:hypothetical protein